MSEPSVYRQILLALVSQLSSISKANGYNTDVGKVFDYDVSPQDVVGATAFIGVSERTFQIQADRFTLVPAYDCKAALSVSIRAYLKTSSASVNDEMRQFVDDIESAVFELIPNNETGTGQYFLGIAGTICPVTLTFERMTGDVFAAGGLAGIQATMTFQWLTDPTNP